jgi:N6-L-threonylcarbamoyladenine synthase
VVASQVEAHKLYGGVVPELASRMHVEAISGVAAQALRQAGLDMGGVDAVAATFAPGLVGALLVGLNFAKGLAYAHQKPLLAVHHLRSHIAANYLESQLTPPFLGLIVSGGHSHIVEVLDYTTFRVVGRTRDDAAGEALDKTARLLGLPYPGGPHLDRLGKAGDPAAYQFPRPKVANHPYDFSFSGLKTAALNQLQKIPNPEAVAPDFAASFQWAVADYLCQTALRAANELKYKTIVLAGGVCANSVLRTQLQSRCKAQGLALHMPKLQYCGDNAAMVGAQGYFEYLANRIAPLNCNAIPSRAIDENGE